MTPKQLEDELAQAQADLDEWKESVTYLEQTLAQTQRRLAWLEEGDGFLSHYIECPKWKYRRTKSGEGIPECTCGFDQWLAAEP